MPIIGITPCRSIADYMESIRRAGGEPRLLELAAAPSIDDLDGLLLTGGGDIDPAIYHETRHAKTNEPDAARDTYELALARLAIKHDLPLLGVCRGLQVINVAGGGTLIQDIPSEVDHPLDHQIETPLFAFAHEVWVTSASYLAKAMEEQLGDGREVLQVNSRHHQAIKHTAAGFDESATAPDGVIEAIERPGARFCVAVQWHPENFWRTGEFRGLFEAFIRAAEQG